MDILRRVTQWWHKQIGQWLIPGMGVKRWLAVLLLGAVLLGWGVSDVVQSQVMLVRWSAAWAWLAVGLGGLLLVLAVSQINRAVLAPFVRPGQNVAQTVSAYRKRDKGPRVAALGGGTGLSTTLRGLKAHTARLTAVVTVADDGGSSGRLRQTLGVLPPGDLRNCLAALADDEALTTQLFQYRFSATDKDLGGHAFGNLFIAAMAEVSGSFERGLVEASRVLNIRGQVLPTTLTDVTLIGELENEAHAIQVVTGESAIAETPGNIRRVYLRPNTAPEVRAYPPVVQAILKADLIVLGPGSLYTSLIPNLLVSDVLEALQASSALKVYVCNTATQPGETDGYSVLDHVRAIERHSAPGLFDVVLANNHNTGTLLPHLQWVRVPSATQHGRTHLHLADLTDAERPWRHDSAKLARALMALLAEHRPAGPQIE